MGDSAAEALTAIARGQVVSLAGEVGYDTGRQLQRSLSAVSDGDLTIEMSHVDQIDEGGLLVLVAEALRRSEHEGKVIVANPSPVVRRLLETRGLLGYFQIT